MIQLQSVVTKSQNKGMKPAAILALIDRSNRQTKIKTGASDFFSRCFNVYFLIKSLGKHW